VIYLLFYICDNVPFMLEMDKAHGERQSQNVRFIYHFVLCPLGFYPIVNSRLPMSFHTILFSTLPYMLKTLGVGLNVCNYLYGMIHIFSQFFTFEIHPIDQNLFALCISKFSMFMLIWGCQLMLDSSHFLMKTTNFGH
jgi:hypothetical protein